MSQVKRIVYRSLGENKFFFTQANNFISGLIGFIDLWKSNIDFHYF